MRSIADKGKKRRKKMKKEKRLVKIVAHLCHCQWTTNCNPAACAIIEKGFPACPEGVSDLFKDVPRV